jgi:hypothetical protein
MKKLILLFASLLMSLTTATASEFHHGKKGKHINKLKRYRNAQPIMFVDRGVEFLVFPDGSFDFNTNSNDDDYRYDKYRRRSNLNTTFGAPKRYYRYQGVSISHDNDGKVRRIGNVYLNYDRYGKIKRAGNVYMNYNRGNGRLIQVGSLHVTYNRWGEIVRTHGRVNHNFKHNYRYSDDCENHWDEDDDFYNDIEPYYYYKQKNTKARKH